MYIRSDQWLLAALAGIALFILTLIYYITVRRSNDQVLKDVMEGRAGRQPLTAMQRLRRKMEKQSWFLRYEKKIQTMIDRSYDNERTIDSVFAWQVDWILLAVLGTPVLHIALGFLVLDLAFPAVCLFMAYRPYMALYANVEKRQKKFDENLPQFINHMCLGFDSGASISKAMMLAIQTLDDDARLDFNQLLIDYQMHTDDPSLAFDHLAERMPTDECRRFCNVTSTGLKNGNEMRKIFQTEADYMVEEYRTRLQENAKKKQNSADVISTIFVFVPIVVIMVAPLMASNL